MLLRQAGAVAPMIGELAGADAVGQGLEDAASLDPASAAELCSTDRDFSRFAGLRWANPLEA